jgi:hypothetical protein
MSSLPREKSSIRSIPDALPCGAPRCRPISIWLPASAARRHFVCGSCPRASRYRSGTWATMKHCRRRRTIDGTDASPLIGFLLNTFCPIARALPSRSCLFAGRPVAWYRGTNQRRDRLWAGAFARYRQLLAEPSETEPSSNDLSERRELLREIRQLKDQIAAAQETVKRYQPRRQSHGFVWLFARKPIATSNGRPASDTASH